MAGCLDLFEPAKYGGSTVPSDIPKFSWLEPTRPKLAVIKDLHLLPRESSHRLVAPVVEIHSIQIRHSNPRVLNEGDKCEIYGRISVADELGDESFIFDRNRDTPELVDHDGSLTLSGPYFLRSAKVVVRMTLWDKAYDDVVIASGAVLLGRSLDVTVNDGDVSGDHGFFARLHYAFYPYAVTATVQVLYFSKDHDFDIFEDVQKPELDERLYDSECGFMREGFDEYDNIDYDELVCGTSVAGIFGSVAASNDLDKSNTNILFRVPPEECLQVTSGSFIKLSRSVVVVPANSSLKVKVDLSDVNTQLPIGRSTVEFIPQDYETYKKDIVGESGRIRVRVEWSDAYQQLDGAACQQLDGTRELLKLLFGLPPAISNRYHPMIEVFSILVFGFEPFYGEIRCDEGYCIYNRGENFPQQCSGVCTSVQLECHRSFCLLDEFGMWVDLKDVEKRDKIIFGHVIWTPRELQLEQRSKWLDRPLCSLIRGVGAFAAVHYEIFSDAVAAKVDVKLYLLSPRDSYRVSGKLIARHGTHDNSSSYDKEYYQSVLFNKGSNDDLPMLKNGSSLPLSKSVVAFPRNSSLIFEVDIGASHVDCDTPIKVNTIFPLHCIQGGEVTRKIQGITFVIVVSVKCEVGFCC